MFRTLALAASWLFLAAGVVVASVQFSSGPPAARTGAPLTGGVMAETDCSSCHSSTVNVPGGSVEILDLPATYLPGQTYAVRVRLQSDATVADPDRRWGFEITAIRVNDGQGAGTFLISTPDLQIKPGNAAGVFASRSYVEHTSTGTHTGETSPVTWTFQWQAPATAAGSILFCAAGNAADGTGGTGNDHIYTTVLPVPIDPTPIASTTWGRLKQRFR